MTTITGSAAGGNWNTNGAWVGGVQPTAADDVLLTAASGNITLPTATTVAARSLNCTGYTGTLTWASTTARLNIGDASGGSALFSAGMTVTLTGIGTLGFMATTASTVYTLTTNGKVMPNLNVSNGATTTIQLADNLALASGTILVTLVSGTLDTNSKTVTAGGFSSSGGSTRTLTLGSSTLTLSGTAPWFYTSTGLTVTANTATVNASAATSITGGGANFNGLSVSTGGTATTFSGASTWGNLTKLGNASLSAALILAADQTITGTLTLTGNSSINRLLVQSDVPGTARTLTVGTTISLNAQVDFEDIVGAGAASWNLTATSAGDAGGNSGITFPASRTLYGIPVGGGANWNGATTWALTSGGAVSGAMPRAQDDIVLDGNSGTGSFTTNMLRLGRNLNFTGFTGSFIMATSASIRSIYGSLTLSSGMTFTAIPEFGFYGRGSHTITMAGKAFTASSGRRVTFGRFGGTYTLQDDFDAGDTAGSAGINSLGGVTIDANNRNMAATLFNWGASTLLMGSGTFSAKGVAAITLWTALAGTTINAGTSNIVIANASTLTRIFTGGTKTYYDLTYTVAGSTGTLIVGGGNNSFHDINFSDASNARSLLFNTSTAIGISGAFNVNGTAGKLMTVGTNGGGTHNLAKLSGTVSSDYLSISGSAASGGASWYAGANSVDGGGNTGWIFTAPPGVSSGNFLLMF